MKRGKSAGSMRKGDVDWKQFATDLLWFNIVSHKNEYSGYDLVTSGDGSQPYWREKKGDIVRDVRFRSAFAPPTKQLSWKELALELGLFEDILTPDGHNCKICPKYDKCNAYFKDDPDQERCSGWKSNQD